MFVGFGTVANVTTVVVGSGIGLLVGHRLSPHVRTTVTSALGLVTLLIAGQAAVAVSDPAFTGAVGSSAPLLIVTEIQVSPRFRRKSVASTLLSAAASHGEDHNCEIVVAAIPVHSREPHRYLTKIGFNQIAVLRAIQASKLRSRLTTRATNSRDTGKLIAVRRTLRRRQGQPRSLKPRP